MKKHVSTILIVVVFIVGLLIMLYPSFSNWYNQRMSSYVVSNYTELVDETNAYDFESMMEAAREYNTDLHSMPTQFISGEAQDETYIETLNVYNGMMGYLVIEEIGVKLPILHGTDEDVLQTSVGHLEGSSLPTGDMGNHTVLTGHTGLPSAELFTALTEMEVGDTFELYILNEVYTYEVYNIVVIEPYEIDNLETVEGKDLVTLVTCTPYGVNSHRLLVQGEQIETNESTESVYEEIIIANEFDLLNYLPIIISCIIIVLLMLIFITYFRGRKRKKK